MRPAFIIHGRRYEIPERLTLGEQRTLKQIAGCPVADFNARIEADDPDAMTAFLLVVMRRTDPTIQLPDVELLDSSAISVDVPKAPEVADDPTLPPESGDDAAPSETPGEPETTPEPSGPPPSATSSVSAPAT